MKKSTLSKLILSALLLAYYFTAVAFDDGIVGFTMKNGKKTGCVCHDLEPDNRVTVSIIGPSTVIANETATYLLRISGGPGVAGGCDIATSLGEVFPSPSDTSLRRDEQYPGAGFELTHKEPKLYDGGIVEFEFSYVAPATPDVTDTIFGTGNSVNYDGMSTDDKWNFAESFLVNVIERPLPVELTSFTSAAIRNDVVLNWTTSNEENNKGFEIERKAAGGDWIKTGFVSGAGNSTHPVSYSFTDRLTLPGSYGYRLRQIDFNGNYKYYELSAEVVIGIPDGYSLLQNYPNPFNPVTRISFQTPAPGKLSLIVYGSGGQRIATLADSYYEAGYYTVELNASEFPSGVYYYRLQSAGFTDTKKMMLVK